MLGWRGALLTQAPAFARDIARALYDRVVWVDSEAGPESFQRDLNLGGADGYRMDRMRNHERLCRHPVHTGGFASSALFRRVVCGQGAEDRAFHCIPRWPARLRDRGLMTEAFFDGWPPRCGEERDGRRFC